MVSLAYDGSLNGDWVSRYAIRFAAHSPERTLNLLHVLDGKVPEAELERKIEHLRRECLGQGVELFPQFLPLAHGVFRSLVQMIPTGAESLVVCGTRVRSTRKPFLSGTVAEQLLRHGAFPVLAVRVVQPGLLGIPRELLIPLAGHPRGLTAVWPFFRLFLPDLDSVHLLRGMVVSTLHLRRLSARELQALREQGVRYLASVLNELRQRLGETDFHLDSRIIVCDDWVREILVHASKLKSRLILLGVSERTRWHRALHGDALERVLRGTPCDVGIYRWP